MNTAYESTKCLVCEADHYETYSTKGQFNLPTHVVICRDCGFSYLNPRWTKERYDQFYSSEYDGYYRPEIIGQNDLSYRYLPIQTIIKRLEERSIKPEYTNILDIGSGMGHALIYLKNNIAPKSHFAAIEPSLHCKAYLEENKIKHLSSDVYSDWDNANLKYDFIIMRHVLEHFHEPLEVLRKAANALSESGVLYLAVPDSFHPTKPLKSHFFRIVHISYFSKNSLSNLLSKAGLDIISLAEGDNHDKNEIFVFCKKGNSSDLTFNSAEFGKQKAIYDNAGNNDFYLTIKMKLISFLRKIKILK
jgi:SAM-dependent methyltransferase